ncbi:MAG: mechanosensitive ion channel family protein [Desulfobacteraceae bacterium]|jgi:small conductance mechanosensitive channel
MHWTRVKRRLFGISFIFLAILLATTTYGQESEKVSAKELKEVMALMEDPQKREGFLKDLKNIIQAREAATEEREKRPVGRPGKKEREVLVIENLFSRFDSISKNVMDAAASTVSLLGRAPAAYERAKSFLSRPENHSKMLRLAADVAAGVLIALILKLLLRGVAPRLTSRMKGFSSKIALGFLKVLVILIPYVAILASLFILFRILPSFGLGHSLALLFFMVLFFYRMTLEVFSVLLSPDEEPIRILPFSNENANYIWIWISRFALYTALYVLVTRTLFLLQIPSPALSFLRGLLLIVFPLMLSIFIMQVSREIRARYGNSQENPENADKGSRNTMRWIVRYWTIPAIVYSWAIFIFLIVHYEKGFHYLFKATLGTVITLVALLLALQILGWMFKRFFAINEKVKSRFPGLEEKTNRYILILRKVFRWVLIIIALAVIAQVWGIPVSTLVASNTGSLVILRAIAILITLGVVAAIIETSDYLKEYLLKSKGVKKKKKITQKRKTLLPMINTTVKIAAGFIGGIVILDRLGVNTTPILAGAGIVGLAVGFGSQTLVKDLINGLFILFEESVRVGDYADLGKNEGVVEAVGLRTMRLRDVSGNVHVVPNSSVDTVTNMTKEFSRTVIDIGVAYREDVDEVMDILREIGKEMQDDPEYGKNILEPIEIFGLHKFDDSAIVVRARLTTKPLKQWGLKREFNRRVKRVFDERGIEIPFPHRTLYMGEPKQGPAAPLNVQLKEIKGQGLPA